MISNVIMLEYLARSYSHLILDFGLSSILNYEAVVLDYEVWLNELEVNDSNIVTFDAACDYLQHSSLNICILN